jgi:X-X-X-Leu-X-X-Gly heptad repeat protein
MAKDAEINLKVNMTPPGGGGGGGGVKEIFDQIKKGSQALSQELDKAGEKLVGMAEGARIMMQRAKDTGSEEIVKAVREAFSEGFGKAATLDVQASRIRSGVGAAETEAERIYAAYTSGQMGEAEAKARMHQQLGIVGKGQSAFNDLQYVAEVTRGDFAQSANLDEMLGKHAAFADEQKVAAEGAQMLAKALYEQADALETERYALDANSADYEKQNAQLLQRENQARKNARAAEQVAEAINNETKSVVRQAGAYENSSAYIEKFTGNIEKGNQKRLASEQKLQSISEAQQMNDARAAAAAENKAASEAKAAEQAQKRAAIEEQNAIKQQKLQEAEIYRTELLGKTKLELGQIIKQLNSEMKSAGTAKDFEQLDALQQKMSIARSAMRNASMQANITRMTFMQQASTASRLSNNISTLADGFGTLAEGAKNGQLNLTGMASSLMDLWFSMKAGMGPVGWLMMGLQGIQGLANSYIRNSNAIKKAEEDKSAVLKNVAAAYQSIETAQKNSDFNKAYNAEVQALKEKYEGIHETLKTNLELIDKSTQAELRRLSITAEEEQLQRALNKMELSRRLEAGEISKAEYEESLLNMDYAAALSDAENKTRAAAITAEAARRKEHDVEGAAISAAEEAKNAREIQNEIGIDVERYNELLRQRTALEQKLLDLKINEKQYLDQESGFDLMKGLNEVVGAGVELIYDVNRPTETFEQVSSAYVDMNKALNEALLGITNELNDVAGRLGTGQYSDFNEVETRNAIKLIDQKVSAAEASAKNLEEEHKRAIKNRKEAQEAAALASEEEGRIRDAKKREFDSQQESIKARDTAEKKRKKREERMEKMLEDVDELTLLELTSMRSKAKKQAGKFGEGTAPRKQYEAHIKRIDREIKSRRKAISDVETAAEAEVQSRAGSNKALSKYSKLLDKVDFKGIAGVLDDGSISMSELKRLQKEWNDAVKARNATAMAFIQKIINDAAESKRQDEAVVGAINKTNLKMAKQAQRMQKKLKTTLK